MLYTARLFHKINAVAPLALPLGGNINSKKFKPVFLDIGLLTALKGMDRQFTRDYHALFRGVVAEQFVGQELVAAFKGDVYYWTREARNSLAEVDYLVSDNGIIKPIEVKSGASGRLRSLHKILDEYPTIPWGYVLSEQPYSILSSQKLVYLPIYFAGKVLEGYP